MNTRSAAVFFVCVIAASSIARAQGIANSFDELRLLVRTGDTLSVSSLDGREVTGKLIELSRSALAIRVGGGRQEWREGDVATIHQRRHDSLANGALWGLVGGVGFVGVIGAVAAANDENVSGAEVGLAAAVYGAVGVGVGVGVDALISKRTVIFERRSAGASLGVAPILSRSRKGALLSIEF